MSGIKRYNLGGKEEASGVMVGYYDHQAAIKKARIESQRETYKRIMRMDLPAWLNKKLSSEVRRCEELLKELSNDE